MNLKTILAAAAVSVTLPLAASAAVVETCNAGGALGGSYDVTAGDLYNCDFNTQAAAGSVQLDFFASVIPAAAMAINTNLSGFGTLTSATLSWFEADSLGNLGALISSVAANLNGGATMLSASGFAGPAPDYQSVVFNWTGFSSTGLPLDINIQVAPVPLPAGLLLMGTALAGFGVMSRRKKRNT